MQLRDGERVGREQVAVTSRDRLLPGDWRLVQVLVLPPPLRPSRGADEPSWNHRVTTLPLHALFAPATLTSASV